MTSKRPERAQGRYEEALPLQERALATFEKALGRDHPHFATALRNLAATYRALGREGDAAKLGALAPESQEPAPSREDAEAR